MSGVKTAAERLAATGQVELLVQKDLPATPKAVFVLVHGLAEHLGRYQYVTEQFNRFGYGVYRFDNRGHGRSGGERAYVGSFMHFVDDTDLVVAMAGRENPGLPLFTLGHSMGGLITAVYGARYPGRLAGQVFSGALVREPASAAELKKVDFGGLPPAAKVPNALSALICRDPEVVSAYERDPLVLKEVSLKLLGEVTINGPAWLDEHVGEYAYPCLILQGGDDRLVDPAAAPWLHANVSSPDRELHVYAGLYHEILNESAKDAIIEDIHRWVEKRI